VTTRYPPLEHILAVVLQVGVWIGSALIALGMSCASLGRSWGVTPVLASHMTTAGIALLILLPILRVILMGLAFYRQRDLPFSALALCVLAIITLAAFLGMQLR
jgi:uncharacterized membrane protein